MLWNAKEARLLRHRGIVVLRVAGSAVVARWPLGPAGGGGEAASPDLPGSAGGATGGAVHGELDAAGVAEMQVNDPPAGERPPGPSGQRPLIGGPAVHADPRPHQRRGLKGDRHLRGGRRRGRHRCWRRVVAAAEFHDGQRRQHHHERPDQQRHHPTPMPTPDGPVRPHLDGGRDR
jgi:hypothetical protein